MTDELLGFLAERGIPLRIAIIALVAAYEMQESGKKGTPRPQEKQVLPEYEVRGGR